MRDHQIEGGSSASSAPFVLVIGAGQAGLAAGYHLKRRGLAFRVLESANRIGDSWRRRYRSLSLFTPRSFSALPGTTLAGDPDGYASRDEFADYLERYAAVHDIPVSLRTPVERLTRSSDGTFRATLSDGELVRADQVIVTTGAFQVPQVPAIGQGFGPAVQQFTPETYREPSQLPAGRVLVVGDGASGRDIAIELSGSHQVLLGTGKPRKLIPERIFGRSVWWWLQMLGLMRASSGSLVGRLMRRADPFPDRERSLPALARNGIAVVPRLVATRENVARFADGRSEEVSAVVWAIGYRDDTTWVDIPGAVDSNGSFVHDQGVSPVPGMFFIGRPWQRNRASGLIMGVGSDAEVIVELAATSRSHLSVPHFAEQAAVSAPEQRRQAAV